MGKKIRKGPPFSTLESMAGANVWHRIARRVFIEQILTENHKEDGTLLGLVENQDLAEILLHDGQQIVENDRENTKRGGFGLVAVSLYKEFRKRVDEIGSGDVSKFVKIVTGKKERYEFGEWQEIDTGKKRRGGKEQ